MKRIFKLKTWLLALICGIVLEGLCFLVLMTADGDGLLLRSIQFFHQPAGFLALLCLPELDTGTASTTEEATAVAILFFTGWLQWWIISYLGIGTLRIVRQNRLDERNRKAAGGVGV